MIPAKSAVGDAPLQGRDKWLLFAGFSGMSFVAVFSGHRADREHSYHPDTMLRTDVATASWTITIYQLASAGLS